MRRGRVLLATTLMVGIVTVAVFLTLPGFSPFGARRTAAPQPPASEAPKPPPAPPLVRIHAGVIELDGSPLARTADIASVRRIEPLYDALARRRTTVPPEQRRLLLDVDPAERAIVVKAVSQTAAFAGYADITFVVRDAGP